MTQKTKKLIDRFPLYRVASDGEIQSKHCKGPKGNQKPQWKALSPEVDERGRQRVRLKDADGKYKRVFVHVLVLEAFVGPRPKRMCACHNDGNPSNNNLSNLRWDTQRNNQLDKREHGTSNRGSRNYNAKLQETDVLKIRHRVNDGETCAQIAREYKVSVPAISNIVLGHTWKHVGGPIVI